MSGEAIRRDQRLRKKEHFHRCYRRGRRIQGQYLAVHFARNEQQSCRIGVTVTRKVGNAVVRNRLKRRAREIYRQWPFRQQLSGLDLVVHFYPQASKAHFKHVQADLHQILTRLNEL